MKLIEILEFYNNYIKDKHFTIEKLNSLLSDCLFRYIDKYESTYEKEKLIDCIKKFNKYKLDSKFNEFIKHIDLIELSETNRLLLIKSIYYEYKSIDLAQMKKE